MNDSTQESAVRYWVATHAPVVVRPCRFDRQRRRPRNWGISAVLSSSPKDVGHSVARQIMATRPAANGRHPFAGARLFSSRLVRPARVKTARRDRFRRAESI